MKQYRALVIDPKHQIVDVVDTDGTHSSMEELIGARALDHFRLADHDRSWDYGWVDEQGLKRGEPVHGFLLPTGKDPLAGRCLIVGADKRTGETCDAKFPLDLLRSEIIWLGLIKPEVTWDETETVTRAIVTYERVKS